LHRFIYILKTFWPSKWYLNPWLIKYKAKKFRRKNYPVRIIKFPSGKEMVLIRNLTTHEHGGWLQMIDFVIKEWGEKVVKMLREEICDIIKQKSQIVNQCQANGSKS